MKKRIALLLSLVMLVATLSGCSAILGGLIILPGILPTEPTIPEPTVAPTEPTVAPTEPTVAPTEPTPAEITIAQALELCGEPGNVTTERYYIRAKVVSVTNPTYGAMIIEDETGSIAVYGTYGVDGTYFNQLAERPNKGDTVLLACILQNYNGTKEVKHAQLISFEVNDTPIDESQYTAATIAEARAAAKGAKVKVTGVVACITYANGMKPAGVILVDGTGSIYVYDGDLAGRVSVGNEVTILAEKDYWILDSEQANADKFGYAGCNQLTSVTYVSGDSEKHDFDKSWIETSTVKEILDTPVTEDITSKIFKVTAQVKKVPGNGFVNYYINDLDGKTGTYTYTQCNGGDFAWLDAFDGKICTVYLTALNAKSTQSDCFWRFLPVAVVDEGFDPSTVNGAEFGVKYYGVGQFLPSYTGNPALELLTSVNAELLGFNGITLSYTSSDPSVISIDGNIMNCHKTGTATITVTGSYEGKEYAATVTIDVTINNVSTQYPTVLDAINANVGDTVTVKGIVGPSLVNKTGFYLIDDSGVIAVETTADVMATLEIGHEVVLSAVRANNTKGGTNYYGQTCLKNAEVVVNNYGSHAYSTASFKGEISVADFYNLDELVDYTTSVYTMKATVVVEKTQYSTNIYLSDGTNKVTLYCSSANQYGFLAAFADQEVTVEIAACNWNDKTYYRGCVLAVVNADGTKTLNTLNFN